MAGWLNDSDAISDARVAVVGWEQETNRDLVRELRARGIRASLFSPAQALAVLDRSDVAIGRLDVLSTLDGVEPGLDSLPELAARGVRVVNDAEALLNTHDKLLTAECLRSAGLPHPRTGHAHDLEDFRLLAPPLVVKPRFGSWGADVFRCDSLGDLDEVLTGVRTKTWFTRHGALVQELVPNDGHDLRLIVAGGEVVGATERRAAPGEWRTNVSLGGTRHPVLPPTEAVALAVEAADAVGIQFAGVDLLPGDDGFSVLELNGAVEFDRAYDLPGAGVYTALIAALTLPERHVVLV